MKVAVAGSTGVVGRQVVAELRRRGHDVAEIARALGIDVLSGTGLAAAVDGADAVIDTLDVKSSRFAAATRFYVTATNNLLAAEIGGGVPHHLVLSIVNADRVQLGYYRAKVQQEEAALAGSVPVTILRSTQFHEFAEQVLDRVRIGPLAVIPRYSIQPVAARDVAARLCDLAEQPATGRAPDLGGPERHRLPDLVRRVAAARRRHTRVVPVSVPTPAMRAIQGGALLPGPGAELTTLTFDEWLRRGS